MTRHGHGVAQGHLPAPGFGHEARAQTVRGVGVFQTREPAAFTHDVAHGRRRQGLGHHPAAAYSPEEGAVPDAAGAQPLGQRLGGHAHDGLGVVGARRPRGVGLGGAQAVQVAVGRGHRVLHGGLRHFGAAPPAACPGKQQQRPVAQTAKRIVAGCQQRLQRLARERGLLARPGAAARVGAPGARQELAQRRAAARIGVAQGIVRLGQHRYPQHQRIEAGRPQAGLGALAHQRLVDFRG